MKLEPFWWEEAPRQAEPAIPLPKRVDVAVIGAGYTGLSAALTLARRSRDVLVLDAGIPGAAASSRNQGHLGVNRHFYARGLAKYGREKAIALFREDEAALDFTFDLIARENIACYLRRNGRFIGVVTRGQYEGLARENEVLRRELGYDAQLVTRADVHREIGSEDYIGGEVRPREGCLHSALFHTGLWNCAKAAGARVASQTPVQGFERNGDGYSVVTPRGTVQARDVLVATNAVGGDLVPYVKRRLLPVTASGIATEPIGEERVRAVVPSLRACADMRNVGRTVRPSPDGQRIIFGGRATMADRHPAVAAQRLHGLLRKTFPQLANVAITHGWIGPTGITFQKMPHFAVRDGVHYALGYSPYGVAQAPYLGHKAALKILRANDAATAFDDLPFETRPFYTGNPWFLPAALLYYRWKDLVAR